MCEGDELLAPPGQMFVFSVDARMKPRNRPLKRLKQQYALKGQVGEAWKMDTALGIRRSKVKLE